MLGLGALTKRLFGSSSEKRLRSKFDRVRQINALEPEMAALSDEALRAKTDEFKDRLARGIRLDDLLVEAFAVVREAAKRTLGQRHFDVQLVGGMVLHEGKISEMKTGEGKTLVATLPVYLNALEGKGVHVVTVNDYLARRDAAWMGKIYNFLGLSVGCIVHGLTDEARRRQYAADVTYGTNNEYGFDYLRDNMKYSLAQMVQRGHRFAIVDEVDSILIDEARTPLIISGPTEDLSDMYKKINTIIPRLEPVHYEVDEKQRQVTLTEEGNERVEELLREAELLSEGSLYDIANISTVHHVNQALKAHTLFQKDRDYIVKDSKVVIIDEFTGRMMEGRRYSDGLHQALEAKEDATIQPENVTLASVTFQNYFRLYDKLAGMTGTAATEATEFTDIYRLEVVEIPTNVPVARLDHDDEVYRSGDEKYEAITTLIADCRRRGQPVLVGTVSIEKSEMLSGLLRNRDYVRKLAQDLIARAEKAPKGTTEAMKTYWRENGEYMLSLTKGGTGAPIPHQVLNARYHEQEAMIVTQAGVPGAVTIATNMAGRGTDIQLGGNADARIAAETAGMPDGPEKDARIAAIRAEVQTNKARVLEAGGLYVIGTERHESRRIDNQLRGRSGRQGDPGASKFFLSLEDDLMRIFGAGRLDGILQRLGLERGEAIVHSWVNAALERAQKKVEARNFDIRKNLLKFDNVMNDQRKAIFEQRIELMQAEELSDMITDMRHQVVEDLVAKHIPANLYPEQWDVAGLEPEVKRVLGLDLPITEWAKEDGIADEEVVERLRKAADTRAAERTAQIGPEIMRQVEKSLLIQTLDHNWREHLVTLDHLRQHVGLRGYAQRDPLNEYKTEAFQLFETLLGRLRQDTTRQLMTLEFRVETPPPLEQAPLPEMHAHHQDPFTGEDEMAEPGAAPQGPARNRPMAGGRPVPVTASDPGTWGKVGRNEACPCGSGKKFKHCHGALSA